MQFANGSHFALAWLHKESREEIPTSSRGVTYVAKSPTSQIPELC